MVQPRIVPWADEDELKALKDWFYNNGSREDMRFRAVQKVKSYQSKGAQYLPHVIDSTAQITSSILLDEERCMCDKFSVKLSYTMSLIRFVNGLLDPTQQSQFAIPLHSLAKRVGLPSWFVDLRHWGTHERELPSLEMLRIAAKEALRWLWDHYWDDEELEEEIDDEEEEESENAQEVRELMQMGRSIKAILAENRSYWEGGAANLISSSNFQVEEPRGKRSAGMTPQEQIEAFTSKCKDMWRQQEDRQFFIETCLKEYQSVVIRLMVMKLNGFDHELLLWLLRDYQRELKGLPNTVLGKRFPEWDVLERKLLSKVVSSVNLNQLAQHWNTWNDIISTNPCYMALWICQALANRLAENRASFKRRKNNRRKQESLLDLEKALSKHIDGLSRRFDDEPQRYDSAPLPRTKNEKQPAHSATADILGDLASLKERLNSPQPTRVLWTRHPLWETRPFGTL